MPSPEILHIGAVSLRWYGLFAALAAIACYAVLMWRSKRYNFTSEELMDLLTCCVIFGIAGARLEYVRRMWSAEFAGHPGAIFRIWEGGLVFQGGFILAALAALVLCRMRKWPVGKIGDLMAVALPCGHAVARIGCFMNGCCFGRAVASDSFWTVVYPSLGNQVLDIQKLHGVISADAMTPLPVLPVQVIESAECLAIAGIILCLDRRHLLDDLRFFVYVILYCLMRVTTECWRGDYESLALPTPAQKTTLFVILPVTLAVFAFCLFRRRRISAPAEPKGIASASSQEKSVVERPRKKH